MKHVPTCREIPTDVPCPRCESAGRTGVFLAEITMLDGNKNVHALRCRHSRCGFVRVLSASTIEAPKKAPIRLRPGFWATVLVVIFALCVIWQVLLLS